MHILEIPSFFPPYGGLFCLDQAKALAALGHEVRILSNVQLGATIGFKDYLCLPYGRYEHTMEGVTVYQSYQRGLPKMVRHNVGRWVAIVRGMFADYVAKYGRPDILHAHCVKWAGYAAMLISREYGLPYVVTEHLALHDFAGEFGMPPGSGWQIPLLRESLEQAACVIPVSSEIVAELEGYFGTGYRWQAVSNMIDTGFFACRPRQPLQGRPFRFCCLALFIERKGYDVLFSAFRSVAACCPQVELHIAGRATDAARCRSMVSEMGLGERVKIHGELDKEGVRDLLYQSDATVLATRGETQCLVLLEALSTGIPAISTEAIPASIRPKTGCTFVPVDDVAALAAAMKQLVDTPACDGRALSEKVRALASPEVIGRRLEAIFSEIVASH